jgi:hypothetical protein
VAYKPISLEEFSQRLQVKRYPSLTSARLAIGHSSLGAEDQARATALAEEHFGSAPAAPVAASVRELSPLAKLEGATHALECFRRVMDVQGMLPELKSDFIAVAKVVRMGVELLFPERLAAAAAEPSMVETPIAPPLPTPPIPPRLQIVKEKIVSRPMSDPSMDPREDLAEVLEKARRGEIPMTDKQRDELLAFGQIVLEGEQKKKEEAAKGRKP